MAQSLKDDVDRLSRGLSTKSKIGNRRVGHRLTQKEHLLLEIAKKQGFLKLPVVPMRKNVENVYRLWCQAHERAFIVRRD